MGRSHVEDDSCRRKAAASAVQRNQEQGNTATGREVESGPGTAKARNVERRVESAFGAKSKQKGEEAVRPLRQTFLAPAGLMARPVGASMYTINKNLTKKWMCGVVSNSF
ncbi:hypothetical protein ACLOJK_010474 [Asimina triloba]